MNLVYSLIVMLSPKRRLSAAICLRIAPALYVAANVWAEPPSAEAVKALDDPSLAVRESATDAIIGDQSVDNSDIVRLLAAASQHLSPEQVHRLIAAGEAMYVDRAAVIGIQRNTVQQGIEVTRLYECPAAAVLREGDIMTMIDGVSLEEGGAVPEEVPIDQAEVALRRLDDDPQSLALINVLAKHRPGDEVDIEVLRNGQVLTLKLPLTSSMRIPGFGRTSTQTSRSVQWRQAVQSIIAPPVPMHADPESLQAFMDAQKERARNLSPSDIADHRDRVERSLRAIEDEIRSLSRSRSAAIAQGKDQLARELERARDRLQDRAIQLREQLADLVGAAKSPEH